MDWASGLPHPHNGRVHLAQKAIHSHPPVSVVSSVGHQHRGAGGRNVQDTVITSEKEYSSKDQVSILFHNYSILYCLELQNGQLTLWEEELVKF